MGSGFKPAQAPEDTEALAEMEKPIEKGDNKAFKAARRLRMRQKARQPNQNQILMEAGKLNIMRPGDVRELERKFRFMTDDDRMKKLQEIKTMVDQMKARKSVGE